MSDPKTAAVNLSTAIESWLPKGAWLWYGRGPWSSSTGNAVPAAVPQDLAFSKLRVEATNNERATLRWKKSGTVQVDVGVYRSADGTVFTLVSDLLSSAVLIYTDIGLEPATRYWYKLSQDGGLSFSQTVTVMSYASRNRGVSKKVRLLRPHESLNVSPGISMPPVAITSPLEEQSDVTTRDLDDKATPCTVCSDNGALVLDCGECNTFRVLMTEDINSITVVGCDPCPTVQFIAPIGSIHGICGWPIGCRQAGDECFEAPLDGGTQGRFREDGVTYNGYPSSPMRGGLDDGACPCTSVFPFNIQCCDNDLDCSVDCTVGASATLKACGGVGPYQWSVTGSGTIDGKHAARTEGPRVKVKVAAATLGHIDGGDIRFLILGEATATPGVIRAKIYHDGHGYCSGRDKYPSLKYAPLFIRLKTTAMSGSPNILNCEVMASEVSSTAATILTAGNAGNIVQVEVFRAPPDGSSTCVGAPNFTFNYTIALGLTSVIDTGIRVALVSSQECELPCADPILVSVVDALGRTAVTTLYGG